MGQMEGPQQAPNFDNDATVEVMNEQTMNEPVAHTTTTQQKVED